MAPQPHPSLAQKEAKIQLAKTAIEKHQIQSNRNAAKVYDVNRETLRLRRAGRVARHDYRPKSRLLLDLEESVVVERILDLDLRGFPPTLQAVGDMANSILAARGGRRVGKNWPKNFVNVTGRLRLASDAFATKGKAKEEKENSIQSNDLRRDGKGVM
jgi:hypothetical protein